MVGAADRMDVFPMFKSFASSTEPPDAFTIDEQDLRERPAESTSQVSKKFKRNPSAPTSVAAASAHPSVQCDICSVPITSRVVHETHIKGKKHLAALKNLLRKNPQYKALPYEELPSISSTPVTVSNNGDPSVTSSVLSSGPEQSAPATKRTCHVCNVSCNSQQMFDNHLVGKKHQVKVKLNAFGGLPSARLPSDSNPSSSNFCDVCEIQLKSDSDLTEHLAQKRHQMRAQEAELCAKDAADLNINFDDYRLPATTERTHLAFHCAPCEKKFTTKMQLIEHLKSASHGQRPSSSSNRSDNQFSRGRPVRRGTGIRGRPFSSSRGSGGILRGSRTHSSHVIRYNSPSGTGAFGSRAPNHRSGYPPQNDVSYSQTNQSTEHPTYAQNQHAHRDETYSSPINGYHQSPTPWPRQHDSYYDRPTYPNSEPHFTHSGMPSPYTPRLDYPSHPLPPLAPPPPPQYPAAAVSSSYNHFPPATGNPRFYPNSFGQ